MGDIMNNEDAIATIKGAIVWCRLNNLPETEASMNDLLETFNVAVSGQSPDDPNGPASNLKVN
jgi:hypothetical protein